MFEKSFEILDDLLGEIVEGLSRSQAMRRITRRADALVVANVHAAPVKNAGESFIRFRSLLLYRNDLAFRTLLYQPVHRFGKKPFHHAD
jgi:hypothetical protein